MMALAKTLGSSIVDSFPVVSHLRHKDRLKVELEGAVGEEERKALEEAAAMQRREIFTSATSIVLSIGVFVGFTLWYGVLERIVPPERFHSPRGGPDKNENGEINEKTVLETLEDIGMGLDALTSHAQQSEA